MGKQLLAIGLVGLLATAASAQLTEVEPNDDFADAQFIDEAFYPFGAVAIDGAIDPVEDLDTYSFDLLTGDIITVSAFSLTMEGDPYLEIFSPDTSLFASNDDAFGLNPFWGGTVDEDGIWYVRVSASPEGGKGLSSFDYKFAFAINPIPEPSMMAVLGLAGIGLLVHRRK